MEGPKLIIVAGLPGAGKTTYLQRLKEQQVIGWHYDDFQDASHNKSPDPHLSRYYDNLIEHLRSGHMVAIADIRYCVPDEIQKLLEAVRQAIPGGIIPVEVHYFENDQAQCLVNAKKRAQQTKQRDFSYEEGLIKHYGSRYALWADKSVKQVIMPVLSQ
jgi:predicted kinase